jgi:hypothetical protein
VSALPEASVFPEAGSLFGRQRVGRFLEETRAAWTRAHYRAREMLDLGDACVVVRGDWGAIGVSNG